jgi:signal peptidase II
MAARSPRAAWWRFIALGLGVVIVDQASKRVAISALAGGRVVSVIGDVVQFTLVRNTGSAFGFFPGGATYLLVAGIVICLGVLIFARRLLTDRGPLVTGLALQFGGGLGNLIDRAREGAVIDFIRLPYWPVFNIADTAITIGIALVAIHLFTRK